MRRAIYAGILVLVFLAGYSSIVRAETVPAKVIADEVKYDYESKQVEATGNVKIEYKNVKIEADYCLIDQDQDVLLATGKVVVNNKSDIYHGDRFLYYLKTQQGWISPLASVITDPQINGPVYLTANEAFIKGEEIRAKHSTFTSCNLDHPHYRFSAKEIEYYPGDLIIMRHVWYWEGPFPIFYFPVLYISLKNNNFEVRVGNSAAEGWFIDVKFYYYYIPNEYSWGDLHTRFSEYGGNYYEVENSRYTSHTGVFTQKYGFLDKQNMNNLQAGQYSNSYNAPYTSLYNDYMLGFGYKEYLNPKVLTSQKLESWHHFTKDGVLYLDNTYNFSLSGQYPYPSNLTMDFSDTGEQTLRQINLATNWNYNPDATSNVSLNGQWYYRGYLKDNNPNISKLYNFRATKDWTWSNLALTVMENQNYNNTYSSSTNLNPDLLYTIPKWKFPVLGDVEIKSQYTHMEKFYSTASSSEGDRYALNFRKLPVTLWQEGQFTLDTEAAFKYRDFFVNDRETELYSASAQVGLKDQFSEAFYTKFDTGYANTLGLTNNYFGYEGDNAQPGAFIKNGWYYTTKPLRASLTTEYNFYTRYAYPANITADWTPAPKEELHFDTIYDWVLGPGQTNLRAFYNPKENWRLSLWLGYNFQNLDYPWTMQQFEALISDRINNKWSYRIATRYDYLMNKYTISEYALIYDWHCREVMFHYDGILREYWVQIFIKAFPDAKLKLTGNNTMENFINALGME
ncbi:MAG: LptA/OstA family protein [Bacillota bacterium]